MVEGYGVHWVNYVLAALVFAMALEGVLLGLHRRVDKPVLGAHGHKSLQLRTQVKGRGVPPKEFSG